MRRRTNSTTGFRLWGTGLLLVLLLSIVGAPNRSSAAAEETPFGFQVTLSEEAATAIGELGLVVPITGRAFVIITRDGSSEPREQIDVTGVPFWGKDVYNLAAGDSVSLTVGDGSLLGYPLGSLQDIPAGTYYVQAFLNVYTTLERADGHVLDMHLDSGDGQDLWESPGNAYSRVQRIYLDPASGGTLSLTLGAVLQPDEPLQEGEVLQQGNSRDTDWVKHIKIQSSAVSEFWGHPMYIGADILLPRGYDENPDVRYPVIYLQGHFPGNLAPFRFEEEAGNEFYEFWNSDGAPRMIGVTFRDANPYYDTSYSVNSANVGPYGDAILQELIPTIEGSFRTIQEPWARLLAGGSTGGWEALALKVWNPDFFGGTWAWCPDAVDFRFHQLINLYEDKNAYFTEYDWVRVERPSARRTDGNIRFTVKQENDLERATGPSNRSGGQWSIWEAVYGPVGADGYPQPIWDPVTGVINRDVAEYWRENYDITHKLQRDWSEIGSKLVGQLTITNGTMDTYYLNEASYLLRDFLESTTEPAAEARFDFGEREPHCWMGESPNNPGEEMSYTEFIEVAAQFLAENAPEGADTEGWRY